MTRIKGWERHLLDFIASRRAEPFAWGANDCCTFANGAALAVTGENVMEGVRPYSTALGAARALVEAGCRSFEELVDRLLPVVPVGLAKRGDLALIEKDGNGLLMVVEGETLVGPDTSGVMRLPRARAVKAWRVG